jgi:hypothetical protein
MMKKYNNRMTSEMLSCRDNMLVENEIPTIDHRPVRDGMWMHGRKAASNKLQATGCKHFHFPSSTLLPPYSLPLIYSAGRSVFRYVQVESKPPRLQNQKQNRCKAGALLLARRSEDAMPSDGLQMMKNIIK